MKVQLRIDGIHKYPVTDLGRSHRGAAGPAACRCSPAQVLIGAAVAFMSLGEAVDGGSHDRWPCARR